MNVPNSQDIENVVKRYNTKQGGTVGGFTVPRHQHNGSDSLKVKMGDLGYDQRGFNFPVTNGNITFQVTSNIINNNDLSIIPPFLGENPSIIYLILTSVSGHPTIGGTLTDSTSGATAIISNWNSNTNILGITSYVGTFSNGDSISNSGFSATVDDSITDTYTNLNIGLSPNYFYNINLNARKQIQFTVGDDYQDTQEYSTYQWNPQSLIIINTVSSGQWFMRLPTDTSLPASPNAGDICFYNGNFYGCQITGTWKIFNLT